MESILIAVGLAGVSLVLVTYGLLASGRLAAHSAPYQWLNVVGTVGILLSLSVQWNLSAFLLNIAWLTIGVVSLLRIYRQRSAL